MIKLPLYVEVRFEGTFTMSPWTPKLGVYTSLGLTDSCETINDWVRILNFQYAPLVVVTGQEEFLGSWMYVIYGTLQNTMKTYVCVYYQKVPIENGRKYYIINENGFLVKLKWEKYGDNNEGDFYQRA